MTNSSKDGKKMNEKKYTITRHIPGACRDGREEPEKYDFSSKEELLGLEFVRRFSKDPHFHQFSLSRFEESKHLPGIPSCIHLMAEYKGGFEWWVVGHIEGNDLPDYFPDWVLKKRSNEKG